ncbi:NAD-dependent epimerase/dehydratase family protein [Pleurocapsa sp. PCC 7319]|uniref:NAD-dependent epimerase/dehydratase family protein n=1 Tax=Pleurocapsa sp. PCC 7319 TaxID=118161 RepID=UPI000348B1A7|nr:NAD-dependent epimerase/dehydratase family protein [Pleurocapsa sp. PCC 7319]
MKILVIGGTNFIGPYVIRQLIEMGHEVTVFNRGETGTNLPTEVKRIKGDRHKLSDFKSEFEKFAPQVVLDMIPYTTKDAQDVVDTFKDIAQRVVAISSGDVYRARDIIWQKETGIIDSTPLTEDSPLRSQLYPYRGLSDDPFAHDYDKIPVEQVLMSTSNLPATILRLPMVYGAGDYQHRLYPYLKRMDDKRPAIVLEEKIAHWQGCYGYVENVAYAIALAVNEEKAQGRIYNVAELPGSTVADLVKAIAEIVGWQGEVVIVPKTQMPNSWKSKSNFDQHWITDSTRIRTELGYTEIVSRDEALKRTITWEREHPPEVALEKGHSKLLDYKDENVILASLKS